MTVRAEPSATLAKGMSGERRPPIDLDHLNRQTLGNRQLQREVLRLFMRHADEQIELVKAAATLTERREAAHGIVGSARGVGAFSVAYVASEIELAKGPIEGRLRALFAAVESARFFIMDFLAD